MGQLSYLNGWIWAEPIYDFPNFTLNSDCKMTNVILLMNVNEGFCNVKKEKRTPVQVAAVEKFECPCS